MGEKFILNSSGRCLFRLAFGFGGKLDAFREIMERVGAQAISSGDVGYELEFMKGLFVRLILWAGDDEFPPSAQILFRTISRLHLRRERIWRLWEMSQLIC